METMHYFDKTITCSDDRSYSSLHETWSHVVFLSSIVFNIKKFTNYIFLCSYKGHVYMEYIFGYVTAIATNAAAPEFADLVISLYHH